MIVKTVIIVIIIVVIIIAIRKKRTELNYERGIKYHYTDQYIIDKLYQMMKVTHEILEKAQIKYWGAAGTLLGIMRHGGIIPWDDDIDIGIMEEDQKKLKKLKYDFSKRGYGLESFFGGMKVFPLDGEDCGLINKILALSKGFRYPSLDIFYFRKRGNIIEFSSGIARYSFPGEFFYENELKKLVKKQFGPTEIYIPEDPLDFLSRTFSKKWNQEAIIYPKHENYLLDFILNEKLKFSLK